MHLLTRAALRPAPVPTPTRPAPAAARRPLPLRSPLPTPRLRGPAPAAAAGTGTAKIIVTGRHVELTDALKAYAEDKVAKAVANYEPAVREVDVRLSVAGGDAGKGARAQRAEVTIYTSRHGVVRVEDAESTAYAALDVVCDKVRAKLRRVKEKAIAVGRWPGAARPRNAAKLAEDAAVSESSDEGDEFAGDYGAAPPAPEEEVLREKTFVAARMTAAAAVDAALALGHDFYVYTDAGTGGVRVVYKRRDRGFGVLVPTPAKE